MREETELREKSGRIFRTAERVPLLIEGLAAAAAIIGLGYYALRNTVLLAPKTVTITQPDGSTLEVPLVPADWEEQYQRIEKGEVQEPTQVGEAEALLSEPPQWEGLTWHSGSISPDALAGYGDGSGGGGSGGGGSGGGGSGGGGSIITPTTPISYVGATVSGSGGAGVSPDALAGYGYTQSYVSPDALNNYGAGAGTGGGGAGIRTGGGSGSGGVR